MSVPSARGKGLFAVALGLLAAGCHYQRRSSGSDLEELAALAGIERPAVLEDFSWLQGAWVGSGLGGTIDEVWSSPVGGAMVGHFRLSREGEVALYELMTLGPIDDRGRLGLKVKHFDPDLTAWEAKGDSVIFAARGVQDDTLRFDGMTIRRTSRDAMEMVLDMKQEDGSIRQEVIRYRRRR